MASYKLDKDVEQRRAECNRIKNSYPEVVPCICEARQTNSGTLSLSKQKYLVPNRCTIGQLGYFVRKNASVDGRELGGETALVMFLENGTVPPQSSTLEDCYNKHVCKDDGMLYFQVYLENTFG